MRDRKQCITLKKTDNSMRSCAKQVTSEDLEENVTVRFPKWILEKVDRINSTTKLSRSDYVRLSVLEKLGNGSHLTPEQKKSLGLPLA